MLSPEAWIAIAFGTLTVLGSCGITIATIVYQAGKLSQQLEGVTKKIEEHEKEDERISSTLFDRVNEHSERITAVESRVGFAPRHSGAHRIAGLGQQEG